jgi:chromosome segregation ATPase
MSNYVTKADLDKSTAILDKKIDLLGDRLDDKIDKLSQSVDDKIDKLSQSVDDKIDKLSQSVDDKIDKAVTDLSEVVSKFADQVSLRFEKQDIEIQKLNDKYDHLVNTIDGFISRIDRYETELLSRDNKIDRLEKWIEAIAKHTGIKAPV